MTPVNSSHFRHLEAEASLFLALSLLNADYYLLRNKSESWPTEHTGPCDTNYVIINWWLTKGCTLMISQQWWASFAILFASPAFRSSSWSVADWTASGHILRNSCHSEVSVTMARARTQNIHHLLLFCWTCSVGPRHFCCWCGRQLVTDWQQLVSMFQAIWGKTACRMPAQAKITSVQLGGRETVHLPDSCHHTIWDRRSWAKSLFVV